MHTLLVASPTSHKMMKKKKKQKKRSSTGRAGTTRKTLALRLHFGLHLRVAAVMTHGLSSLAQPDN
jgi:cell division protein FtsB